jgi:hypothetical protein
MLYMVVERFRTPGAVEVYRRARDHGRIMPEGLRYISSWVDMEFTTCFQLMETEHRELFDLWTAAWDDLVDFQIVPVQTSASAVESIAPRL